jgi:hypothetical protein
LAGRVAGEFVPSEEEFTIHNKMLARLPKDDIPPKYTVGDYYAALHVKTVGQSMQAIGWLWLAVREEPLGTSMCACRQSRAPWPQLSPPPPPQSSLPLNPRSVLACRWSGLPYPTQGVVVGVWVGDQAGASSSDGQRVDAEPCEPDALLSQWWCALQIKQLWQAEHEVVTEPGEAHHDRPLHDDANNELLSSKFWQQGQKSVDGSEASSRAQSAVHSAEGLLGAGAELAVSREASMTQVPPSLAGALEEEPGQQHLGGNLGQEFAISKPHRRSGPGRAKGASMIGEEGVRDSAMSPVQEAQVHCKAHNR